MSLTNIPMDEFINLMKPFDPKIIMEIGSLNGADSILFKKSFPDSRVITIEGLPANYSLYLKNFFTNIETYNLVINSYDGVVDYFEKDVNGIHGIYDRGSEYGTKKLSLPCMRIDSFCNVNNINYIDAVKIDVEGATLEVLESFGDILKTVKIMHIETEDYEFFKNQHLQSDVHKFLIENKFENILSRGAIIQSNHKQYDEVWVRKNE